MKIDQMPEKQQKLRYNKNLRKQRRFKMSASHRKSNTVAEKKD